MKYLLELSEMKEETVRRSTVGRQQPTSSPHQQSDAPLLESIASEETQLAAVFVEMVVVLLQKTFEAKARNKQTDLLRKSFLLDDICETYRPWLGKLTPVSTYPELAALIARLEQESTDFAARKFVNEIYLHRLLNYLLEANQSEQPASEKKKKKIHTQSRIERLVFIWRKVKENQKISLIDLSNMIPNELEEKMPFKVDKKTIMNLVKDLEHLRVVVLNKYKIVIESQKIVDLVTSFNRSIVSDAFVPLTEEMIADDPCIKNPTFKRNSELPVSLKYLSRDTDGQARSPTTPQEKRFNLLQTFYEKEVRKEALTAEEMLELRRSEVLARLLKSRQLRMYRDALNYLRSNVVADLVSECCERFSNRATVTERFLQNLAQISTGFNYLKDVLVEDSRENGIAAADKSRSLRHLEAVHPPALSDYFSRDDQTLLSFESAVACEWLGKTASDPPLPRTVTCQEVEELAGNSEKNLDHQIRKLQQALKKSGCVRESDLAERSKNPKLFSKMVKLLALQGDIEENNYLGVGFPQSFLTLKSK